MRPVRALATIALAAVFAASVPAFGQNPSPSESDDGDVVQLDTVLVEVPTVVSERGGRYVTDLRVGEFTVLEDGVPQKIDLFSSVDVPFNVALMLDCSGSTREQLDRIKAAALAFVDQLRPADRVAVVTFEDEVRVATSLTGDRENVRRAIESIQTGKFTQVYEAVHAVAEDVLSGVEGRRAAILFSDGVDTASSISTFDDSLDEITREQILVYPIRFATRTDVEARVGVAPKTSGDGSRPRRVFDEESEGRRRSLEQAYHVADAYLGELAERTGGILYRADTLDDLPAVFANVAAELRHQYLLGYYPTNAARDDGERRITVEVSRPNLLVRSRNRYRAPRAEH